MKTLPSERLVSLDAFRGLTMMLMVLVNNGGSDAIYHQFQHSAWNGWTLTDAVFPSFVWIIGVAITLSLGRKLSQGVAPAKLLPGVIRRAAFLYLLGLSIYVAPAFDLRTQRLLGVLQRIAICYLIGAAIYLFCGIRGQVAAIVALLAIYWLLMTLVPVPGYGAGDLTVAGNFAHYVDRIVLGSHNYRSAKTWDPEGIVSTLPAIATLLLGVMAGHIVRLRQTLAERSTWLYFTGACLLAIAAFVEIWLPVNKKLWTDSFCLLMAGLDCVVFASFLWIVDGQGLRRWTKPFVIMGMNAIAVYLMSEFFDEAISLTHFAGGAESVREWIFQHVFASTMPPSVAALAYAVAFTALMYLFAYVLYRRKIFLRV